MKKKWLVAIIAVTAWVIVTSVFYIHHQVTIKSMSITGWEFNSNSPTVLIKEVRLINKNISVDHDLYSKGIPNWVLNSKFIPEKLKFSFLNVLSFYGFRYSTDDAWYIEVSGVYSNLDNKELAEGPDVTIKADGKSIIPLGGRSSRSSSDDFRFFTVGGKDVNPDLKNIEVIWKWGDKSESKQFKATFNTHSYNFFEQKPREYEKFDPEVIASKLFFDYMANKKSINPELAQKLAWVREHKDVTIFTPSTSYLSSHKKFSNVLVVRMNYILNIKTNPDSDKIDATQDFYLVEKNRKLEVIDIGPFK